MLWHHGAGQAEEHRLDMSWCLANVSTITAVRFLTSCQKHLVLLLQTWLLNILTSQDWYGSVSTNTAVTCPDFVSAVQRPGGWCSVSTSFLSYDRFLGGSLATSWTFCWLPGNRFRQEMDSVICGFTVKKLHEGNNVSNEASQSTCRDTRAAIDRRWKVNRLDRHALQTHPYLLYPIIKTHQYNPHTAQWPDGGQMCLLMSDILNDSSMFQIPVIQFSVGL